MSRLERGRPASLAPLYASAVASARRKGAAGRRAAAAGEPLVLPSRAVVLPGVAVDADRAAALAAATGVPLRPALPAVAPHLLAFAAQLRLLAADDFPLPLPGLVHVTQRLRQHRSLRVGERVDVRVSARGPLRHARGAVVELDAVLTAPCADGDDEVVWEGTSGYLARGASAAGAPAPGPAAPEQPEQPEQPVDQEERQPDPAVRVAAQWSVPAGAGRAYARTSGDVNPIHLSALAARSLGFRGAIAHGMWTLARAVGQVEPRLGGALAVEARFGSPLLLGSRAVLCVEPAGGGWALAVRSGAPLPGERVHLTAVAAPLRP